MSYVLRKKILIPATLLFVCVSVLALSTMTERASAQVVPVQVIGGTINVDGGAGTQPEQGILRLLQDIHRKEFEEDPKVYQKAQEDLQKLAEETIDTLNNGNDGDSLWIKDYKEYIRKARQEAAGRLIYEDFEQTQMCSEEIKFKVQEALAEEEAENSAESVEKFSCPLEEQIDNIEAFKKDGISGGGLGGFIAMISEPDKNTPIGVYIEARIELENAKNEAEKIALLEEVDGYIPTKKTTTNENGDEETSIIVPAVNNAEGSKIVQKLPFEYPPDELGEEQNSVWTDLLNRMLSGVDGLLGLGTTFSEIKEQTSVDTLAGGVLEDASKNTLLLLEYQLEITTQIDVVRDAFNEASTTFSGDNCWDLEFPENLTDNLTTTLNEIPLTIATILALEALTTEYNDAIANGTSVSQIASDFEDLVNEGLVATETRLQDIEILLFEEIEPDVEDFESELEDVENECS